mgnify:CR=1 FL=1
MSWVVKGWNNNVSRSAPRNHLTSTYTGIPPGVMRSADELFARINGGRVDYLRAPVDEDKQDALRAMLIKALERSSR